MCGGRYPDCPAPAYAAPASFGALNLSAVAPAGTYLQLPFVEVDGGAMAPTVASCGGQVWPLRDVRPHECAHVPVRLSVCARGIVSV